MVKKNSKKAPADPKVQQMLDKLPKDAQEKIKKLKTKLDTFKTQVLDKFDNYVVGLALLPPPEMAGIRPPQATPGMPPPPPENKDQVNILVLIDDSDSKTMTKYELKAKLAQIIDQMAQKIDKNIMPQVMILTELWQNCMDQKYEILKLIALSQILYDKGTLAAVKISEIHKNMVLQKFERYIVSYVLAGSIVQGRATAESDVDVFIVIDDTDVKRMTRYELKEKLRAIIISMGIEAGEVTGIRNKLNIQVYILTDFWESVREANPIIFTFLRDGIPLHDTGTFLPWKQLLKLGKIKPSPEAIDLYMHSGEQIITRIKKNINTIGMEDTYWAILTPSQAALMLYGVPPPTPRETPELMRQLFVKKDKILEDKYVKILEENIRIRKDLEHGKIKQLSGADADKLVTDAEEYLKRINKLFVAIREQKEKESVKKHMDDVTSVVRDVLKIEGVSYAKDSDLVGLVKTTLVDQGKLETKYYRKISEFFKFFEEYKKGKFTKADIAKAKKARYSIFKRLSEYIQMVQGKQVDKCKIHVKHGKKFGEVIMLEDKAFITFDLEAKEKEVSIAKIKDGRIANIKKSSLAALDKALVDAKFPDKSFIKESLFEDLRKFFGKNVEILVRR